MLGFIGGYRIRLDRREACRRGLGILGLRWLGLGELRLGRLRLDRLPPVRVRRALSQIAAVEHGLLVTSTHPQADRFAGDQTLLAPAFVSTDGELAEMIERFVATIDDVERTVKTSLAGSA